MKIKAIAYFLAIAFIISAAYVLALSPEVTLTFPDEGYNSTSSEINLSANISGDNVSNVTLYGN